MIGRKEEQMEEKYSDVQRVSLWKIIEVINNNSGETQLISHIERICLVLYH